jgi:hypothetical protein
MHTIIEVSEGVGFVTHYDVMFEHGIEKNVPVENLQIIAFENHMHSSKKKMKEEAEGTTPKTPREKELAKKSGNPNLITKGDVLAARGVKKEGWAKFAGYIIDESEEMTSATVKKAADTQLAQSTSGKTNMQQDSVNKMKNDPLASKENCDLPPTQGNKPIGGEGTPSRVMGKYSMEESTEILENLYASLNETNKQKFDAMLESEDGLEFLLQFAEKQGF